MITRFLKYNIIFLFILFSTNQVTGQNRFTIKQVMEEGGDLATRPLHWNTTEWLTFAAFAGGAAAIMKYDDDVRSFVMQDRSLEKPFYFGTLYGEPLTPVILGGFLGIHGGLKNNAANSRLGYEIGEAFVFSTLITGIIKYSFGRARPSTGKGQYDFHPFSFRNNDFLSFSSGHSAIAFSMSTVLSEHAETDFWRAAAYVPAFITVLSRVYHNRHWLSDVFFGAAVGYFTAKFVTDIHRENDEAAELQRRELLRVTVPF